MTTLIRGGTIVAADRSYEADVLIEGETIKAIGTGLTGELAEPTLVAGVMLPTETVVRLDLATGEAEATTRPSIIDP